MCMREDAMPRCVAQCIAALVAPTHALYTDEGIFRVPGDAKAVHALNAQCDAHSTVDLSACRDAPTLCGLLKLRCGCTLHTHSHTHTH